eukprot:GCRY01004447.1.p1 GENE.GCRY01004447.1~~GCRY01004447.1.p1  ORF type:complete len:2087 (+),score=633.84 GCRY01004447.1:217-6477(+)
MSQSPVVMLTDLPLLSAKDLGKSFHLLLQILGAGPYSNVLNLLENGDCQYIRHMFAVYPKGNLQEKGMFLQAILLFGDLTEQKSFSSFFKVGLFSLLEKDYQRMFSKPTKNEDFTLLLLLCFSFGTLYAKSIPTKCNSVMMSSRFICNFYEMTEKLNDAHNESLVLMGIRCLLCLNMRFRKTDNVVIHCLELRKNPTFFCSNLLNMLNRQDPDDVVAGVPCIKMLSDIFSRESSASLIYSNDLKVLIEVVCRNLDNTSCSEKAHFRYVQLIMNIVKNSRAFRETLHCKSQLANQLQRIADDKSVGEKTKHYAAEALSALAGCGATPVKVRARSASEVAPQAVKHLSAQSYLPQYEDELQSNRAAFEVDRHADMLIFDPDDLQVKVHPRVHKTELPVFDASELSEHSCMGLELYTSPETTIISSKETNFTALKPASSGSVLDELSGGEVPPPPPVDDVLAAESQSETDPVRAYLVTQAESMGLSATSAVRMEEMAANPLGFMRKPEFNYKPLPQTLAARTHPTPEPSPPGVRLLLTAKDLRFTCGFHEPHFCSLALYDASSGERVSADFTFDFNPQEVLGHLGVPFNTRSDVGSSRSALFTVYRPSKDICLVLQINKVLFGDADSNIEGYTRANNLEKVSAEIEKNSQRLSRKLAHTSQALAFGILPVFTTAGGLALGTDSRMALYRHPGDRNGPLAATVLPQLDHGKLKMKEIKGHFLLSASHLSSKDALPTHSVSEELLRIASSAPASPTPASSPPVKHILCLQPPLEPVCEDYFHNMMYIWPETVSFLNYSGKTSARNLAIRTEIRTEDSGEAPPLHACVYSSRSVGPNLLNWSLTETKYHEKQPVFNTEIKLKMPTNINPATHHVLFTFVQVSCKDNTADEKVYTPVGYSVLKLQSDDGVCPHGALTLPVYPALPKHYLAAIDSHKLTPLDQNRSPFKFNCFLSSSIYHSDAYIGPFLQICSSDSSKHSLAQVYTTLQNLALAPAAALHSHLSLILHSLLSLVCRRGFGLNQTDFTATAREAVVCLLSLCTRVYGPGDNGAREQLASRPAALHYYIHALSTGPAMGVGADRAPLYEVLAIGLAEYAASATTDEKAPGLIQYVWVVLDLITRGMALSLHARKSLRDTQHRGSRFAASFDLALGKLSGALSNIARLAEKKWPNKGVLLVRYLGVFTYDLLGLYDRTRVFEFVHTVLSKLHSRTSQRLMDWSTDYLRLVCDHPSFVPLNMPTVYTLDTPEDIQALWHLHWPIAILCKHMLACVQHGEPTTRQYALDAVEEVQLKLDYDTLYEHADRKTRLADIWFPLLTMSLPRLHSLTRWTKQAPVQERIVLYSSIAFVFRHTYSSVLLAWARIIFTPPGGTIINEPGTLPGIQPGIIIPAPAPSPVLGDGYGGDLQLSEDARGLFTLLQTMVATAAEYANQSETVTRQTLAAELAYIVLDVVVLLLRELADALPTACANGFLSIFQALLEFNLGHDDELTLCVFGGIRTMLATAPSLIFAPYQTTTVSLCKQVLRYANSAQTDIRVTALATAYFLIKINWQRTHTVDQARLYLSLALTQMVSELTETAYTHLLISLHTLPQYPEVDEELDSDQAIELEGLVKEIASFQESILTAAAALAPLDKTNPLHFDLLAEKYFTIAETYVAISELRMIWLHKLFEMHLTKHNPAEAGFAMMFIALLYYQMLQRQDTSGLPFNFRSFEPYIPGAVFNAAPGAAIPTPPTATPSANNTRLYSPKNLTQALRQCIGYLREAELLEPALAMYQVLAPIRYHLFQLAELEECYRHMAELVGQIRATSGAADSTGTSSAAPPALVRSPGAFYRLVFYGKNLGPDLEGQAFVARYPPFTHLFDITPNIEREWAGITVIKHSHTVKEEELSPDGSYVQITSVDPYFTREELSTTRLTEASRMTGLTQFVFESPYTKTGEGHGTTAEQWKRRTILTTALALPGPLVRVRVHRTDTIDLSPIEAAIEQMENRNLEMRAILRQPSAKTLQQVLQGSILLQVNAGPLEICESFLRPSLRSAFAMSHVRRLQSELSDFLELCEKLLNVNRTLLKEEDQMAVLFHSEMDGGYKDMLSKIAPFLR